MPADRAPPSRYRLQRSVGRWGLVAFVFNGLVGSGVFAFPGVAVAQSGGLAPLVVLAVGAMVLPTVMVLARLATLFDGTGGPILYVGEAFGPAAGFQMGWLQILSGLAGLAANANVLADYLLRAVAPGAAAPALHLALVVGTLALVIALNLVRVARVARLIEFTSLVKLAPLLLLILLALPRILALGHGAPHVPPVSLVQGALITAFAFFGFEGALTVAGEARDPERDLPWATLIVFAAVTLLYALLCWCYGVLAFVPGPVDAAPLASLAGRLMGSGGIPLVAAGVVLSIFAFAMFVMLATSRRMVALAEQGTAPAWLARTSAGQAVPRNAVLLAGGIAILLAANGGFTVLALLTVASRLVVYLGCCAALPVVARRRGLTLTRAERVWLALAVASSLALIAGSTLTSWIALGVTVAIGALVGVALRRGGAMLSRGDGAGHAR